MDPANRGVCRRAGLRFEVELLSATCQRPSSPRILLMEMAFSFNRHGLVADDAYSPI